MCFSFFPKLGQRLDQPAGTLVRRRTEDAGDRPRLLGEPKLLLLDEPTEGVWIGVIEEITERLIELAKEIAVVIVEQHLDLALRVADYAYVLDRGRVVLQGAAGDVRRAIRSCCGIWRRRPRPSGANARHHRPDAAVERVRRHHWSRSPRSRSAFTRGERLSNELEHDRLGAATSVSLTGGGGASRPRRPRASGVGRPRRPWLLA